MEGSALLRCAACRTVNRVPANRLTERPKCGKCKAYLDFPHSPVEGTTANFQSEAFDPPGYVLVFLWAPWCVHCRGMMPGIEEVARRKAGRMKVVTVNTEKETYLAQRFGVMSVPRLTLYRGGRQIDEVNGALSPSQLEDWTEHYLRQA
ncbi:MAG: thioredoxin domain-containing protein [Nitrospiraceae bacterium]|nr:thioredoxin domain-containing protein [Nitrospiraceae bacterium]